MLAAFALGRLFLDQAHVLSNDGKLDPLSVLIATTVAIGSHERTGVADGRNGRSGDRTPLSRRAIASATGLPRETVRRRAARLVDQGVLAEVDGGLVPGAAAMASRPAIDGMAWTLSRMIHTLNLLADAGILVPATPQGEAIR